MYTELLRKHVKLCSFDEIQNQLSAVIPERFTMEQKSALASSVRVVIFVGYSAFVVLVVAGFFDNRTLLRVNISL